MRPFVLGREDVAATCAELLQPSGRLAVVPVDRAVLVEAARQRAVLGLRMPDTIHVATALASACGVLLTNDRGLRLPAGIRGSCRSRHPPRPRHRARPSNEGTRMLIERRLAELGIELPRATAPAANYVNAVRTGNLLFLAGKGPYKPDGTLHAGTVGQDVTVEEAYAHARLTGLHLIATMKEGLGDLDRVARIVKVLGMVNAPPGFAQQPEVINGCSDLFVEVFGERGRHARSAVGMGSLPRNITVEIEAIVEVA